MQLFVPPVDIISTSSFYFGGGGGGGGGGGVKSVPADPNSSFDLWF